MSDLSKVLIWLYFDVCLITFAMSFDHFDDSAVTPKELYEINHFPMSICILLFIVLFVVNPLFFLTHFVRWLMHIGRKE